MIQASWIIGVWERATRVLILAIAGSALLFSSAADAQSVKYSPEAVKAAYLFHFGSYVEWPQARAPKDGITIGIVGAESVVAELRKLLPGRSIQDRPVQVRALTPRSNLDNVQILYIGRAGPTHSQRLIEAARAKSILVITDDPEGIRRGSMINFVIAKRRVRFEISRGAAESAGIRLSSRLLAVALRVHSSGLWPRSSPQFIPVARLKFDARNNERDVS